MAGTGSGLTSERARERMVDGLRAQGIRHEAVLAAMASVPRHTFVDQGLASRAYEDVALPIGQGQTISKPSTVARMIELAVGDRSAAALRAAKVLEVGTGCGYQAAVLAGVFGEVVSIERLRWLHETARTHIRPMRLPRISRISSMKSGRPAGSKICVTGSRRSMKRCSAPVPDRAWVASSRFMASPTPAN